MFEIWGALNGKNKEKDNRISAYLTHVITPEESRNMLFFSPFPTLWKEHVEKGILSVMTFKNIKILNSPYVTLPKFKKALVDFLPYKEKILVALSAECTDWNLSNEKAIPLTLNAALFKCGIHCSKVFFDELAGTSYFTYMHNSPHLVWIEDTKSIALKHNLIKSYGYKGIYWENPYPLLEGNWEALTAIYKKA